VTDTERAAVRDWFEFLGTKVSIYDVFQATELSGYLHSFDDDHNLTCACPFCGKDWAFRTHEKRRFYHCFSCKKGGDSIKLIQEMEGVGFLEAADRVGAIAGRPCPVKRGPDAL